MASWRRGPGSQDSQDGIRREMQGAKAWGKSKGLENVGLLWCRLTDSECPLREARLHVQGIQIQTGRCPALSGHSPTMF